MVHRPPFHVVYWAQILRKHHARFPSSLPLAGSKETPLIPRKLSSSLSLHYCFILRPLLGTGPFDVHGGYQRKNPEVHCGSHSLEVQAAFPCTREGAFTCLVDVYPFSCSYILSAGKFLPSAYSNGCVAWRMHGVADGVLYAVRVVFSQESTVIEQKHRVSTAV